MKTKDEVLTYLNKKLQDCYHKAGGHSRAVLAKGFWMGDDYHPPTDPDISVDMTNQANEEADLIESAIKLIGQS